MNNMSRSIRCVSDCRKYKFSGMQRTTSCRISPRSSSSVRSCCHGDDFHFLANVRHLSGNHGIGLLTFVSSVRGSNAAASSSGLFKWRRKCVLRESYADLDDDNVRGHVGVFMPSKSKNAFQHADLHPAVAIEHPPSSRTAFFNCWMDAHCFNSFQASLALSMPRILRAR